MTGSRSGKPHDVKSQNHSLIVEAIVEIPRGSRNKYEMDHATSQIHLDRVLYSSVHYPTDYGFIPGTMGGDGDPLDVLIVVEEPTFPGCHVVVRLIGALLMKDEKGLDEKLIAVPIADPRFDGISDINDLQPHWLLEIENFFVTYKKLEGGKETKVEGWKKAVDVGKLLKKYQDGLQIIESRRRPSETVAEEARMYAEAIIDTVREPLVVLDENLKVLSVSRSFYETFKVTPGETVGHFLYDLGNGQWDIPQLRALLDDIFKNTKLDNYEVDHTFPAIGHRFMLLNARRIYTEDAGTKMILLAIEDVTDLKQTDEALKASETRYRRLFETAQDGILILNAETSQIDDVNPFLMHMLGYSYDEFVGKKLWEIGAFQDTEASKAAFAELQREGYVRYEDLPLRTKDGLEIAVEFVSNVYGVNHQQVIQCNIRDITDRKRAERELQTSEELFRTIARVSSVGLFRTGKNGHCVYVNEYWCGITGLSPEEAYGEGWMQVLHTEDRERVATKWYQAVQGGSPFTAEFRFQRRDGVTRWVIKNGAVEKDQDGEKIGYVGAVTDITDRKQMETKLRKAHDELEQRVKDRTAALSGSNKLLVEEIAERKRGEEKIKESQERLRLLTARLQKIREQERASLSRELHDELGQVLTGMKMDVRWIEKRLPESSKVVLERVDSLVALIDNAILSVQRISRALRPPVLDHLGLTEAIRSTAKRLVDGTEIACEVVSKPKDIVLEKETSTAFFRIFQEALTNITRHAQAKRVIVSLKRNGDKVIMEIGDDGRGITKEEIEDPTSIGLTGMRERAYAVGGSLTIIGVPRKGTTVTLSVPLNHTKKKGEIPD